MEIREIYVLCKERSKKLVFEFLDRFFPEREASSEDYPYPEYSDDPECVYDDCDELFEVLENNTEESYSVYWDSTNDGEVKNAMVFFTEDGGMIVGIAVECDDCGVWLKKLSEVVEGEYGYVSFDSPPPETRKDFIMYCKNSDQVKLMAGDVV